MTDRRKIAEKMLHITPAFRHYHDHHLDPAYRGRYFMRLLDGTCVPIDKYEARLEASRKAQRSRERGEAGDPAP